MSTPEPPAPTPSATTCAKPPAGWRCTRKVGHDGPCAAVPETESALPGRLPPMPSEAERCALIVQCLRESHYNGAGADGVLYSFTRNTDSEIVAFGPESVVLAEFGDDESEAALDIIRWLDTRPVPPASAPAATAGTEGIIAAAREEIRALCNGDKQWRMCVPVESTDSDEVFGRLANLATAQATELAALRALLSAFVAWDEDEDEDTPNRWDSLDTLFNSARAALAPHQTTGDEQ